MGSDRFSIIDRWRDWGFGRERGWWGEVRNREVMESFRLGFVPGTPWVGAGLQQGKAVNVCGRGVRVCRSVVVTRMESGLRRGSVGIVAEVRAVLGEIMLRWRSACADARRLVIALATLSLCMMSLPSQGRAALLNEGVDQISTQTVEVKPGQERKVWFMWRCARTDRPL